MLTPTPPIKLIDLLGKLTVDNTGYLKFQFQKERKLITLYLGVINGRIVYSSDAEFNIADLFAIIKRYTIQTRIPYVDSLMDKVLTESRSNSTALERIETLIRHCVIDEPQLLKVLRTKILRNLDETLFMPGSWEFIAEKQLSAQLPLHGSSVDKIIEASIRRIQTWKSIKFSMSEFATIVHGSFLSPLLLPRGQRDLITDLISERLSISQIAVSIARDDLDVAVIFSDMQSRGVISIPSIMSSEMTRKTPPRLPPIIAVDSSAVMLNKLCEAIAKLGYPSIRCGEIETAIDILRNQKSPPALVIVDLNMIGFGEQSLIQVLRENPILSNVPVAIMSDRGRAANTPRSINYHDVKKIGDTAAGMCEFQEQISGILTHAIPSRSRSS
jgi:CheY-like chemotaxis protein